MKNTRIFAVSLLLVGLIGLTGCNLRKPDTEQIDTKDDDSHVITETTESVLIESPALVQEPESIDVFDYVTLNYNGIAPDGTAEVVVDDNCPVEDLVVSLSADVGLNNGDEITVSVSSGSDEYVFEPSSKSYTVSGLTRTVTIQNGTSFEWLCGLDMQMSYDDVAMNVAYVPEITMSGLDTSDLNNYLYNECYTNQLENYSYYVDYSYYISDKYISLLFVSPDYHGDLIRFHSINISVETGEILDKESFLSIIGYSVAQFDQEVSVALENYMTVQGWFDSYGGGRSPSCVCDSPFEENLLESNISEAMPFVSDRGYLCFTYSLYTQMGYQSNDVCIDLVTNDYIDEINEQPMNVNWISCTN